MSLRVQLPASSRGGALVHGILGRLDSAADGGEGRNASGYAVGVLARLRFALLIAATGSIVACGAGTRSDAPRPSLVVPLDLQVRNSGLRGGYVWLSVAGDQTQSRWHRFGQAEFICVTCPEPFVGSGSGYEIAVLDESCRLQARYRVEGGALLVEIDLGPTLQIIPAPPLLDWMPEDSSAADPANIPCGPPVG